MELLLQVWCPLEDSPHDRALYIWGCSRGACQKTAGSVRAFRALRFNEEYAAKLNKKLQQKAAQKKTIEQAKPTTNPFVASNNVAPPGMFGLGDQIFGQSDTNKQDEADEKHDDDASETSSEHSLITAMASTSLEDSVWSAAPSHPPLYLSTISEYLPPQPKAKKSSTIAVEDALGDDDKGKDISWATETYENSIDVDHAFERFTKRVGYAGEQCLRYELGGTPLPFASDKVFETLFPTPAQPPLPVTKADFKVVPAVKRSYKPSSVPRCPHCNSARVFECQLMPNLINILRESPADSKKQTNEQRIKEVQVALKGGKTEGRRGMEWGTCMVFSCEKDCCNADGETKAKECWREEFVMIQWDE